MVWHIPGYLQWWPYEPEEICMLCHVQCRNAGCLIDYCSLLCPLRCFLLFSNRHGELLHNSTHKQMYKYRQEANIMPKSRVQFSQSEWSPILPWRKWKHKAIADQPPNPTCITLLADNPSFPLLLRSLPWHRQWLSQAKSDSGAAEPVSLQE